MCAQSVYLVVVNVTYIVVVLSHLIFLRSLYVDFVSDRTGVTLLRAVASNDSGNQ